MLQGVGEKGLDYIKNDMGWSPAKLEFAEHTADNNRGYSDIFVDD